MTAGRMNWTCRQLFFAEFYGCKFYGVSLYCKSPESEV
ncbi:hypothetical protein CLOBOL_02007 [Enterocloster bolteae ATCC BAA-613]|uniref:Uncharacterized protein n=1 Tax=Enterocloster bolteae (strain ATCC BAA-613 / DSM 15670 / CCUG 46953 / JCM 12243 / WAL 16351) TaxID=411902 RepID=A8RMS2_ENTBW|nr:hypothetical protein CLOBOL_02007 [Enterocloster bolteae ATCC BAA-613]